jgi:hypothetical protein
LLSLGPKKPTKALFDRIPQKRLWEYTHGTIITHGHSLMAKIGNNISTHLSKETSCGKYVWSIWTWS